jgi:hypothetical protein
MKLRAIMLTLVATTAFAADNSFLPSQFAGWKATNTIISNDPSKADTVNASLLKEYGFTDVASATYSRENGKLTVKAARFADASGAYGAFLYYKLPPMLDETIGDQGASLNERVLFYRGNILVDAVFDRLTTMSAAELRELANDLPRPIGNLNNLPPLPAYLPKNALEKNSAKYVLGPVALSSVGSPLGPDLVDFSHGAEVMLGKYNTAGGEATLLLIAYPTPQIAMEHLKNIDAARQQTGSALAGLGPSFARRTGPMVVVASGSLSQSEGNSLVGSVNYQADVTWNENTYNDKKNNIGNLVVNALLLCAILMGFALVIGVAFGGARILLRRLLPQTVLARSDDADFISLHLEESRPAESGVNPSIRGS